MKIIIVLIVCTMMFGCAHSPMKFQLAPGTNQADFQTAKQECGGDSNQGSYFLFGPLIILAPVVAVVEGVKYQKRGEFQKCMEAKGFKCLENCPNPTSEVPQKPIDPQVLANWTETIRNEKEKEWVCYTNDPNGLNFYYNPQSITVVDQRYIFYRDQIKCPADWKEDFSYIWRSVKVNCADKIFKLSDFVAIDKAGNTRDPKTSETAWQNLPETSPMGTFAYKQCKERVVQGTEGDVRRTPLKL